MFLTDKPSRVFHQSQALFLIFSADDLADLISLKSWWELKELEFWLSQSELEMDFIQFLYEVKWTEKSLTKGVGPDENTDNTV